MNALNFEENVQRMQTCSTLKKWLGILFPILRSQELCKKNSYWVKAGEMYQFLPPICHKSPQMLLHTLFQSHGNTSLAWKEPLKVPAPQSK